MAPRRSIRVLLLGLAIATPACAADLGHARRLVTMVYDVGQYSAELDRLMARPSGAGATGRPRDRSLIHTLMLQQREAVLRAATEKVAARASDAQVDGLLNMAAEAEPPPDPATVAGAVAVVKSSFDEALGDQLARTSRGAAEFPCTKEQRSRC